MKWPADGSPARFTDLVEPLIRAFNAGATWRPKTSALTEDIPWDGLSLSAPQVGCPKDQLSAKWREHDREQGRSFLVTILSLAVMLGMEQGQKIEREQQKHQRGMLRVAIKIQEGVLEQLELALRPDAGDPGGRDE